jgi:hypothetical protein
VATRPVKASLVNAETLRQTANSQCGDAPDLTAVDDANVNHTFTARDAGSGIIRPIIVLSEALPHTKAVTSEHRRRGS